MIKIFNRVRREFKILLDKKFVSAKLSKRRGECKRCGKCCEGCKFLGRSGLCSVYGQRPVFCYKDFPIDELDQKVFGVRDFCGYWFEV